MQKCKKKKNLLAEMFCILQDLLTQKTQLIKALHSLDSSRPYERLLENPKTEGSRELFLLENNSKTCYTGNFLKKHPDFGGLETNQRHEIQVFIFFTCSSTYELN